MSAIPDYDMTHTSQNDEAATQNSVEEVIDNNLNNEDSPQVKSFVICLIFPYFVFLFCYYAELWQKDEIVS